MLSRGVQTTGPDFGALRTHGRFLVRDPYEETEVEDLRREYVGGLTGVIDS